MLRPLRPAEITISIGSALTIWQSRHMPPSISVKILRVSSFLNANQRLKMRNVLGWQSSSGTSKERQCILVNPVGLSNAELPLMTDCNPILFIPFHRRMSLRIFINFSSVQCSYRLAKRYLATFISLVRPGFLVGFVLRNFFVRRIRNTLWDQILNCKSS